jgi:hypothetical protein
VSLAKTERGRPRPVRFSVPPTPPGRTREGARPLRLRSTPRPPATVSTYATVILFSLASGSTDRSSPTHPSDPGATSTPWRSTFERERPRPLEPDPPGDTRSRGPRRRVATRPVLLDGSLLREPVDHKSLRVTEVRSDRRCACANGRDSQAHYDRCDTGRLDGHAHGPSQQSVAQASTLMQSHLIVTELERNHRLPQPLTASRIVPPEKTVCAIIGATLAPSGYPDHARPVEVWLPG